MADESPEQSQDPGYDVLDLIHPDTARELRPPSWEEVAPKYQQLAPDLDQEGLRQLYESGRQEQTRRVKQGMALQSARDQLKDREETWGSFLRRSSNWVVGVNADREYSAAQKRLAEGTETPGDYTTVAGREKALQEDAQRGFWGSLGQSALRIPMMVGESTFLARPVGAVAGKVLPFLASPAARAATVAMPKYTLGQGLAEAARGMGRAALSPSAYARTAITTLAMPSMWAEQMAHANMEAGRDPLDPRGFAPAFGLGMVNTAVLGSLGPLGQKLVPQAGARAFVNRLGIKVGAGVLEQSVGDLLAGASGLSSHYGPLGDLVAGRYGQAGRTLASQALTFAVFGMMHEGEHGTPFQQRESAASAQVGGMRRLMAGSSAGQVLHALNEHLNEMHGRGQTLQETIPAVEQVHAAVAELLETEPYPSREMVAAHLRNQTQPGSSLRMYANALAETFPARPVPGPPGGPGGLPSAAGPLPPRPQAPFAPASAPGAGKIGGLPAPPLPKPLPG